MLQEPAWTVEGLSLRKEALTITVINETRSLRHCFVREVGIGSRMQLFVGDFIMSGHVSLFRSLVRMREQRPFKNSKGWWVTWARVKVFAYTFNLVTEIVTKPIGQITLRDVWWERVGAGPAQQLVRHGKKLPAGRTGADLLTEEPPLGCLNTRPYRRSLLGVDFSVNCETSLSPPSLSLSSSSLSLPDLLGHPGGGGAVSRASGDSTQCSTV